MLKFLLLSYLLVSASAIAQHMPGHTAGGMQTITTGGDASTVPVQGGQAAFATIQEIVDILDADPKTDWTKVDIEGLRQHLIDMDNVTLHAVVTSEVVNGGVRFIVSDAEPIKASIQRMASAHAMTLRGVGGWKFASVDTDTGVILTVKASAEDTARLKALGFIGVMTRGMHHQVHHLMIARGDNPHR